MIAELSGARKLEILSRASDLSTSSPAITRLIPLVAESQE